ncbi:MAG: dynamin family protein [Candidatus Korobacteraceae bacterium]
MQDVEDMPIPNQAPDAAPGDAALGRLGEIADALGERSTSGDVRQLAARINEGRFFVACVGQFKRGKSTLLNALVGEPILPTGIVPVTTVPTVLRHGAERTARVLIQGKWRTIRPEDLSQYVSEEMNPENVKQVEGVEAFLPSPLLASGMCLVDTPGIGSVFSRNTEATHDFIPQIDAAILVVGADPPISGEELGLIETVAANVDQILIVLNKIDRVTSVERQQASVFATRVLAGRLKRSVGRIYEVSALSQLSQSENVDDWDSLVEDLGLLASESGQIMTRSAAERGLRRFSAALRRSIEERARALKDPIADSERRIAKLRQTVSQAEQSLRDLGALFSAEQMRLSNILLARRKEFLRRIVPLAVEEFACEIRSVRTYFGPARRRDLMFIAQTIARRHMMPWLDAQEAQAEELYEAVTSRFVGLVNGLLMRIAEEQSADFSHLPKLLDAEQGFRTKSRFLFHDMITVAQPASPLLYGFDTFMGALRIRGWFRKAAQNFLIRLLDTNASRVQGDVEQRVVESRLRLEADVRKLLREVSATAEQALTKAREVMSAGVSAVESELERLRKLQEELETISGSS